MRSLQFPVAQKGNKRPSWLGVGGEPREKARRVEFSSWVKGNLRGEAAQAFFLSGDLEKHPTPKEGCKQNSRTGGGWASRKKWSWGL